MVRRLVLILLIHMLMVSSPLPPAKAAGEPSPGLHVLRSDAGGILLRLGTPVYSLDAAQGLDVEGLQHTAEPGMPELPFASGIIAAPPGAEMDLEILSARPVTVGVNLFLPRAPHPARWQPGFQPGRWVEADPLAPDVIASQGSWYPQTPALLGEEAWMGDQRLVRIELYPFRYRASTGELLYYPDLEVEVHFRPTDTGAALAPSQDSPFAAGLQQTLLNPEQADGWRSQALAPVHGPLPESSLGPRYRIVVEQDGLYRLSKDDLAAAGVDVSTFDPRNFRLVNQGDDVAVYISGEADGRLDPQDGVYFYGQAFRGDRMAERYTDEDDFWQSYPGFQPQLTAAMFEKYTRQNVYYLLPYGPPGPRMKTLDGLPNGGQPASSYRSIEHREESHKRWAEHLTSEDTWFWDSVTVAFPNPIVLTRTYAISLSAVAGQPVSATLRGEVVAKTSANGSPDHHIHLGWNDLASPVYEGSWDGATRHVFTATLPAESLLEGLNELHFEVEKLDSVSADTLYFDWFEVEYSRQFQAERDALAFQYPEDGQDWVYQLKGFSAADIRIFDVSNPLAPKRVLSPTISLSSGSYQATFEADHSGEVSYLAAGPQGIRSPESVVFYQPPDLFDPENGADYIFITPRDLYTATQALAGYRAGQGLRTWVVVVDDLYAEFNDGILHPLAIKRFLAYAFSHWHAPAPAYVLLVGSGHWNMLGYDNDAGEYSNAPVLMPPNLAFVDPWIGETDSLDLLVNFVGEDILPDIHAGRLPAHSEDEVLRYLKKLVDYEAQPFQNWQKNALFVADNADDAGNFPALSDSVIQESIPASVYQPKRVYLRDYPDCPPSSSACSQVTAEITRSLNMTGALFVNYIGHGFENGWASEGLLQTSADPVGKFDPSENHLLTLWNNDQLPVVLSMTCLDGYWMDGEANRTSLAAEMVLLDHGGAIATFSATGQGIATGHDVMNKAFFDTALEAGEWRMGALADASKLALFKLGFNLDLVKTYQVFGDPALHIQTPYAVGVEAVSPGSQQAGKPGQAVTFQLEVENIGSLTDTYQVRLGGAVWPSSISVSSVGPLEAGAIAEVTITVQVPEDAEDLQQDQVTVEAVSQSDSSRRDSVVLTTTTQAYGVEVFVPKTSQDVRPGESVVYDVIVTNSGLYTDSYRIELERGDWPLQFPAEAGPLPGDGSQTISIKVTSPLDVPNGESETTTMQVISQTNAARRSEFSLLTTVGWSRVYLPVAARDNAQMGGGH